MKDLGDFANALGSALSEEQSLAHLDALGVSRHLEHYRRTLIRVDAVRGHDAHDGGGLPDVSQVHRALETLVDGSGVKEDMHVCLKQSQKHVCLICISTVSFFVKVINYSIYFFFKFSV